MMNTSRPETTLYNLKSTTFPENHILFWYADIIEYNLCVTVRSVLNLV